VSELDAYPPSAAGSFASARPRAELKKVPVRGGSPLTLCAVDRSRGASWGPDGSIVFAPSPEGGLFRMPAAEGDPEPLTVLDEQKWVDSKGKSTPLWDAAQDYRQPVLSPDGRRLAVVVEKGGDPDMTWRRSWRGDGGGGTPQVGRDRQPRRVAETSADSEDRRDAEARAVRVVGLASSLVASARWRSSVTLSAAATALAISSCSANSK